MIKEKLLFAGVLSVFLNPLKVNSLDLNKKDEVSVIVQAGGNFNGMPKKNISSLITENAGEGKLQIKLKDFDVEAGYSNKKGRTTETENFGEYGYFLDSEKDERIGFGKIKYKPEKLEEIKFNLETEINGGVENIKDNTVLPKYSISNKDFLEIKNSLSTKIPIKKFNLGLDGKINFRIDSQEKNKKMNLNSWMDISPNIKLGKNHELWMNLFGGMINLFGMNNEEVGGQGGGVIGIGGVYDNRYWALFGGYGNTTKRTSYESVEHLINAGILIGKDKFSCEVGGEILFKEETANEKIKTNVFTPYIIINYGTEGKQIIEELKQRASNRYFDGLIKEEESYDSVRNKQFCFGLKGKISLLPRQESKVYGNYNGDLVKIINDNSIGLEAFLSVSPTKFLKKDNKGFYLDLFAIMSYLHSDGIIYSVDNKLIGRATQDVLTGRGIIELGYEFKNNKDINKIFGGVDVELKKYIGGNKSLQIVPKIFLGFNYPY